MATTRPSGATCELRRELRIGGCDPASREGEAAFRCLPARMKARYLHKIDYLEADVARLLAMLDESERLEVLSWRDSSGTWQD